MQGGQVDSCGQVVEIAVCNAVICIVLIGSRCCSVQCGECEFLVAGVGVLVVGGCWQYQQSARLLCFAYEEFEGMQLINDGQGPVMGVTEHGGYCTYGGLQRKA